MLNNSISGRLSEGFLSQFQPSVSSLSLWILIQRFIFLERILGRWGNFRVKRVGKLMLSVFLMLNFLAEGDIQGLVLVLDFETGVFFHRLIAFAFFLFSSFNLISLYCAYGSSLFPTQIDIRDVVAVIVESAESSAAHPITKRILVPDEEVRDGMLNDRNATTTTLIAAGTWLDEKLATSAAAAAAADGFGDAGASPTIADESLRPFMESLTLAAVLLLLILFCVIGNVFVIVAIACERDLRGRPQYYLIFSLAVADLVVGLIVTPLGAWSTVAGEWRFGITLCDIWISVDVIMCTASILHLVAIALDRYWSVTDISYVQNRTPKRIVIMLAVIWMTSLLISLAPFAGWKDEGFKDRVLRQHVCLMSQQISYQVFSTATAFYIPLIAIICVYWKIMRAAKKRFKRERDRRTVIRPPNDQGNEKSAPLILKKNKKIQIPSPPTLVTHVERSEECRNKKSLAVESSTSTQSEEDRTTVNHGFSEQETKLDDIIQQGNGKPMRPMIGRKKRRSKETAETKRERKAWRTLAIITGTFVACWTPFFLVSLYRPICRCTIPRALETITAWLGYLNSALNPIIYTVFSQDFRAAFKKIIKRLCLLKEY